MTKELLSEVLDVYVYELDFIQDNRQFFKFTSIEGSDDYQVDNINIYEISNSCKEWALKQGYRILTEPYNDYGHTDWMVEVTKYEKSNPQRFSLYESEHDAVDKACEWILKQKKVEL